MIKSKIKHNYSNLTPSLEVKFVTDRWTDKQMDNCKTICPQSFYLGAYKERIKQKRGRLKIMFPVERLVVGCIGV